MSGAVALIVLTCSFVRGEVTYRAVALSGESVPGMGPGVRFIGFQEPVLNQAGDVAFRAFTYSSGGGPLPNGIWAERSGSLVAVAKTGDTTPGLESGTTFGDFDDPVLNEAGQVAFLAGLSDSMFGYVTYPSGLWAQGDDSLDLIAMAGKPAPGTEAGVAFQTMYQPTFNAAGDVLFVAELKGVDVVDTNEFGVWLHRSGSMKLIARMGDSAPPGDFVLQSLSSSVINEAGQIAFSSRLDSGIGVVWMGSVGDLSALVPFGGGGEWVGDLHFNKFFSKPVLNNAGEVTFRGGYWDFSPDRVSTNNEGIWSGGPDSLRLVACSNCSADGVGPGVLFDSLGSPLINSAGQTVFMATITGPGVDETNNWGIWREHSGSLTLLMRGGDAGLEIEPGATLGSVRLLSINGLGQIVFSARIVGSDGQGEAERSIWIRDTDGTLHLMLREGDVIDVSGVPGSTDLRVIQAILIAPMSSSFDSHGYYFNDAGQLAVHLGFADGSSGIIVATIPEPGIALMVGVGLIWMMQRRG